jgi:hypothetical protein
MEIRIERLSFGASWNFPIKIGRLPSGHELAGKGRLPALTRPNQGHYRPTSQANPNFFQVSNARNHG